MKKLKKICRNTLTYIAHRKILKYSLILTIALLPVAGIMTGKYFNSKNLENKVDNSNNISESSKEKDKVVTGTINTEATAESPKGSSYTVSNGFSKKNDSSSSNQNNNDSSSTSGSSSNTSGKVNNIDKSSLSGKDTTILEGDSFNPIKDLKLKATDKNGRDISNKIEIVHNPVNTTKPGNYAVTASVKLNDGNVRQRSFNVDVKATDLNVSVASFKATKEDVKKRDSVVLDLDLDISKRHVTPKSVMINGQEHTLYKSTENILDRVLNTNRYKVATTANSVAGIQEYNMSYIKMSDNTLISTDNTAIVNVLKSEPSVKNFRYEKKPEFKKLLVDFYIEDIDKTASNSRIEFYKDGKLLKTEKIDSSGVYNKYLNIDTNGKYELKVISDVNLYSNTEYKNINNKVIFKESINIEDIDESSLSGKDIEIIQGSSFDPIKDLSIKATDVNGKDITNKVIVESNVNTDVVGNYYVLANVVNENGRKINKKFKVEVSPIAEVISFDSVKNEFDINENISFKLQLEMKKSNAVAKEAEINGKNVSLIPQNMKNIFTNTKTYLIDINGETSEGDKNYTLSSIIMEDGKEINLNEVSTVKVSNPTTSKLSRNITKMASSDFDDSENYNYGYRALQSKSSLIGSDTKPLTQNVKVSGRVSKKDGSAPDGKIEVELPTTMSFSVDQKGNFYASDFSVTNNSSADIEVSVSSFMDLNPNDGITIKPIGEDMSKLDRSNLNLALSGNVSYVDLGKNTLDTTILEVPPLRTDFIRLHGQAGKSASQSVDNDGAKDKFNIVFNIKKKN